MLSCQSTAELFPPPVTAESLLNPDMVEDLIRAGRIPFKAFQYVGEPGGQMTGYAIPPRSGVPLCVQYDIGNSDNVYGMRPITFRTPDKRPLGQAGIVWVSHDVLEKVSDNIQTAFAALGLSSRAE